MTIVYCDLCSKALDDDATDIQITHNYGRLLDQDACKSCVNKVVEYLKSKPYAVASKKS